MTRKSNRWTKPNPNIFVSGIKFGLSSFKRLFPVLAPISRFRSPNLLDLPPQPLKPNPIKCLRPIPHQNPTMNPL